MSPRILLIALALLCPAFTSSASAQAYFRANAVQVEPDSDGADDTIGALFAFGTRLGAGETPHFHQLEAELGFARWDESFSFADGPTTYTASANLRVIPILATYRFEWQLNDRVSLAVGPSVGATLMKTSATASGGGMIWNGSDKEVVLSYGAGVQFNFHLSRGTSVTLGYRLLVNDEATFEFEGVELPSSDIDVSLIELGLRFSWPSSNR